MKQTKRQSLIEASVGTVVGLVLAFAAQALFFWVTGIHMPWKANLALVAWMTVVSVVRGYYLRRFFDWVHHNPGAFMKSFWYAVELHGKARRGPRL